MMTRALSLLLLLSFFLTLPFMVPEVSALEPGTPAPDFELPTLEGRKVRLSDYQGQIILLKLSTTWCPTCRQQTEAILETGDFLAENEVRVVDVFLQDSEAMVREYLQGKDYAMPYDALLDDGQARRAYNVYLIPRVLVIDREFVIRRDGNLMKAKKLKKEIRKVAGEDEK